ncbi:hypothetical protein SS50377_20572 [Spironucleus salmonicida]|uniref:Uncharacterized protein n=1 Tax=Spironucleus salmonicida TaxID=348837 RepID=V6LUC6_9EUKA|nr:hypothetical protein SS50377_20572 [Spironucleus salmonicida]|eukprot:EST48170.1 Hypothetical protein SS50377_11688 [Spironucleus salmonicida]
MPRDDRDILLHYLQIVQTGTSKTEFNNQSSYLSNKVYRQEMSSSSYTRPLSIMAFFGIKYKKKKQLAQDILIQLLSILSERKSSQLTQIVQTFSPLPADSEQPVVISKLDELSVFQTAEILQLIQEQDTEMYNFVIKWMCK